MFPLKKGSIHNKYNNTVEEIRLMMNIIIIREIPCANKSFKNQIKHILQAIAVKGYLISLNIEHKDSCGIFDFAIVTETNSALPIMVAQTL